ncbi:signal peptidase I [Histidinibacterium aquaticum]|uniref:Signal peptidase I n=1 Tax=Histidinibacterium aquaticum TaxID=2613962 RepID=A0A5J5GH74_9RHOB|nr:signal peptidase I [Histidinibacterium aquaticum]KAA9007078.1 signal peptidase I [Histidinibacterium aquaticum]
MAENQGVLQGIWETVKTVVYALLIAGIFRTLFFQPFWIPSGSMKDTLLIGDFLFVNKMAYGYSYASCPSIRIPALGIDIGADDFCGVFQGDRDAPDYAGGDRLFGGEPDRGDVVVFRHPVTGRDFIKRLIGLPGDQIRMEEGRLIINDEPVGLEPDGLFVEEFEPQGPQGLRPRCSNGAVGLGADCEKRKFVETLPNGVSHSVLDIGRQNFDTTGTYTVPEGYYFFMGDNRDNSRDSRESQTTGGVGFVPYEDLVGRADRVMFSSAGRSMLYFWTWRGDRFFEKID